MLHVLALQEMCRQVLQDPAVKLSLAALTAPGVHSAILSGVVALRDLPGTSLEQVLSPRLDRYGVAALRLDAEHIALAVVAAGPRAVA